MRNKLFILFLFTALMAGAQNDIEQIFEGEPWERLRKAEHWSGFIINNPDSAYALPWLKLLIAEAENHNDEWVNIFARYQLAYYHVVALRQEDFWLQQMHDIIEKSEKDELLWVDMLYRTGVMYYIVKKEFSKGLGMQLRAYNKLQTLKKEERWSEGVLVYELGRVYYEIGNYEKCIELLRPLLSQKYDVNMLLRDNVNTYIHLQILNTMGMAYRNSQKPDSALAFFLKTLEVADSAKDYAWVGIASINIAKYHISKGNFDKALPYAKARYTYSIIKDIRLTEGDSCEALIVLAQIDVHKGKLNEALDKLGRVQNSLMPSSFMNGWNRNFDLWRDMYRLLSKIYFSKSDFKKAYTFNTLAMAYQDSILQVRRQVQSQKVHTEVEAEKQMNLLKEVEQQTSLSIQSRSFSLILLALTGLLLFILYNRQRIKSKTDAELYQNREKLLVLEKQQAEEQLSTYLDTLQEKNKLIEGFGSELEHLKSLPNTRERLQMIDTISTLRETTIITEEDWVKFKYLFDKAHKGFFVRVRQKYPDITQAEMRLLALTKLNLSTKDKANMLGISPASIRKTGYRFLKKISSDGDADLNEIVASI